ncbi:hypothetical protein Y032_0017g3333 [Ancylostoma ceylanicum]|uniref:Uncharacterized protein n=1 Tax=Ancylostoma ceylanicum TaxID=53326 RepID=A0A016V407_9BILA|nr:hypothetical protein Y032_0017g3333 [Ancylostoma ceylanicum]
MAVAERCVEHRKRKEMGVSVETCHFEQYQMDKRADGMAHTLNASSQSTKDSMARRFPQSFRKMQLKKKLCKNDDEREMD